MKILRVLLLLAVVAYAGWLAWPVISPLLEGADPGAAVTRMGAEMGSAGTLTAVLWMGAVLMYLIAAGMLGSGNPRAAAAYFLGFLADAALRLAIDRGRGSTDVQARSAEASIAEGGPTAAPGDLGASLGVDPVWLVLGALVVLGLLILVVTRRRRRGRTAGQLAI